jgi:Na+-transporting NADH:ubiquinone oxidoreductase subunit NqrE
MRFRQLAPCVKLLAVLKYVQSVEENGFAIVPQCLAEQMVEHLCSQLGYTKHAQRNLLDVPVVRELTVSEPVKQLAAALLGKRLFTTSITTSISCQRCFLQRVGFRVTFLSKSRNIVTLCVRRLMRSSWLALGLLLPFVPLALYPQKGELTGDGRCR